jgi:hypothetical protein
VKHWEWFAALKEQMIHFFKIFQKRTSQAKSWRLVRETFRTRTHVEFFEKKIFLIQHEQKRQKIRRLVLDLSSSQNRETQVSWIVAISFVFRRFKTKLNDEFYHRLVVFETQKYRAWFDVNDNKSLYQIQFLHFSEKNLKCKAFDRRIDRRSLYQIWKTRFHCYESRFLFHFKILKFLLLSFMNTTTIQHHLSLANWRANRKTESNSRSIFKMLCQLSTK